MFTFTFSFNRLKIKEIYTGNNDIQIILNNFLVYFSRKKWKKDIDR